MNKFIVTGSAGSGRTTLIKRLIDYKQGDAAGFFTEKFPDRLTSDGFCPIYIYPVNSKPIFDDAHLIGLGGGGTHYTNSEVFDSTGISLISVNDTNTLIVMDEVGFLESDASAFQNKLFEVLKAPNPVVIIMKQKMQFSLMQKLSTFSDVELIELTSENRDDIFEHIKTAIL